MTHPTDIPPALAERLLELEGGRNFRDLGGYDTRDGRQVKRRVLYRSGSMAGLTPAALEQLAELDIKAIIDLRTGLERTAEPNPWCDRPYYWCRDYERSFAELARLMESGIPSPEVARLAMLAGFRELPFEQADSYTVLFQRIAAGHTPMVFHCTAGKDRTGAAAAILLDVLGVAREIIMEDFALTDHAVDLRRAFQPGPDAKLDFFGSIAPEVVATILSAQPGYIAACLEAIDERCGSTEQYLQDHLAMSSDGIATLRETLLQ